MFQCVLGHSRVAPPRAEFAKLHAYAETEGATQGGDRPRRPALGHRERRCVAARDRGLEGAGVTQVTLNNTIDRFYHRRIPGRTRADHLDAMTRYRVDNADLLR